MRRAMLEHNYYLQYHLYTLAADLFLERRLPSYDYQTHFGGVYYIFLRGVDPKDPGTVTTPFHFDRNIKLSSMRIGVDENAPKEFVDKLRELGATLKPSDLDGD